VDDGVDAAFLERFDRRLDQVEVVVRVCDDADEHKLGFGRLVKETDRRE